jgi:hypothetical protein
MLDGLRPLLVTSRLQDPPEKISFVDQHWVRVCGGRGVIEISDQVIYLAIALRNVGRGMAILHGWIAARGGTSATRPAHAAVDGFRQLTRDLYVPAGDLGFWQGALRDPAEPLFTELQEAASQGDSIMIELLYGDHEGGQRTISRFSLLPHEDQDGQMTWLATVARHWNLDRPDPR